MPPINDEEEIRVEIVRSSERLRAAERLQVWRSESTSREFEVREVDSYEASVDLSPGAAVTSRSPAARHR